MGLHTWFYKDRVLYDEAKELYNKLDKADEGEIYLDELESIQIYSRLDEIEKLNDADFHDCFRTNKRNEDGTYTDDVIYSKEECDKWLQDNVTYHFPENYKEKGLQLLNEFWKKYPNGVIDFG